MADIQQLRLPDISDYSPELETAPNFAGFVKWAAMCHAWTQQAGPEIARLRKENDELQSQNGALEDEKSSLEEDAREVAVLQELIADFDRGVIDKEELIRKATE